MDFDYKNKPVLDWDMDDCNSFCLISIKDPEAVSFFEKLSRKEKYYLNRPKTKEKTFKLKFFNREYKIIFTLTDIKRFGLNSNDYTRLKLELLSGYKNLKINIFGLKIFDITIFRGINESKRNKLKQKKEKLLKKELTKKGII